MSAAMGPLQIHKANPRYFCDAGGKVVYLAGSHTWNNFQDWTQGAPRFDYGGYLDFLNRHHQNHIRLWVWEHGRYAIWAPGDFRVAPLPYRRSHVPGAHDGLGNKYDLEAFNPAFFKRLRDRVVRARDRGVYVQIVLFQGRHSLSRMGTDNTNPWEGHPFHQANNVDGVDGDPNGDGNGAESHTLELPVVTRLQEAYVREVVDTVNDLDNVLYEIANEDDGTSLAWQCHFVDYVKRYQAGKPKQHPVVLSTLAGAPDFALWESAAVAPWYDPFSDNLPPADGRKVLLTDTDHVFYGPPTATWVWKTFTRGQNPLAMDAEGKLESNDFSSTPYDAALGQTRRYAQRLDLAAMIPRLDLASTRYCLADEGREYLVFQPGEGSFTVELPGATFAAKWFDPRTGNVHPSEAIAGGPNTRFTPPLFTRCRTPSKA